MVGEKEGLKLKKKDLRDVEYLAPQAQIFSICHAEKGFPQRKNDVLQYTLLKIFACGAKYSTSLSPSKEKSAMSLESTHLLGICCQTQSTFMPRKYGGEKGGLKLKTRDLIKPGSAHMKMSI